MSWKKICDGRGALRSRFLKMGVKESKSDPVANYNVCVRPVSSRPSITAPEKVVVWPKNSERWQKPYDVYICCSDEDIGYAKALLSYLQEQPEHLRCFLPMRDMNPGGAIPTEMSEGAESSHCWIMLLTSASLSDQWCQYQMHQFLVMAPHGNGRLIPILVELPFECYPKELKHMYGFRDAKGDQSVFQQVRKTIVSYLKQLPKVPVDQETESSNSESDPSSRSLGTDSQVPKPLTLESTSESSETQGTTGDTAFRSSMTQGSFNITSAGSNINHETPRDASLKWSLVKDPAINPSQSTSYTSMRSSPRNTAGKHLVNQEAIGKTSQKSSCIQESPINTSERCYLKQEYKAIPGRISTIDLPLTSPVTQVSTSNTFMRSPAIQESTNEPYLRSWSPKPNKDLSLKNYEIVASNTNTPSLHCKTMDSNTSTRTFNKQEYPATRKGDCGSCRNKEAMNMECQSFESDVYTASARFLSKNKGSSILQSNSHSNCGGAEIDKKMFQVNTCIRCGDTNADINDSLDFQKDVYTTFRPKEENMSSQSLQTNIYTSCAGPKTENIYGGAAASGRDTQSMLSSGMSKDVQSFRKDGDSKILLEDLYTGCGGMQTENADFKSYQSDLYRSYNEKHAHMNFQTDLYTSSKEEQSEKKTSYSFQSDLYTSSKEIQEELKSPPNLQGKINTRFVGLQASSNLSESLQNDLYTSSDGTQKVSKHFKALCGDLCLSGAAAWTVDQNLPALHSKFCTAIQAENKDSDHFSSHLCGICPKGRDSSIGHGNIYMNSISTQAVKPTIHTHRDDANRPPSEAADKT